MQVNYVMTKPVFTDEGSEPVTLTEMKKYLRISVDETYDDDLITQLITTARKQVEDYLSTSLIDRTIEARLLIQSGFIHLPYWAESITITGVEDDNDNAISSDNYKLKGDLFCAYPSSNATPYNNFYDGGTDEVVVTYDVEWPDGLPAHFKTAIMQQCAWLFERGRGDELAEAIAPVVKTTMKPYRRVY